MRIRHVALAAACCAVLASRSDSSRAGDLVVHTGETVQMPGGFYQFDSLTIQPGGSLLFDNSTRLNISGNVVLGHDTIMVTTIDPDTGQPVTRTEDRYGQLFVTPVFGGATSPTSGGPGAPGANGETGNPLTIGSNGTPGGPGGAGGHGASAMPAVQSAGIFGLQLNSAGNVTIDGIVGVQTFTGADRFGPGNGGPGGVGGVGGNGDAATHGDGASGGSGGAGGSGGSAASTSLFTLNINAAGNVAVGPTAFFQNENLTGGPGSGAAGGKGGRGGSGGQAVAPGKEGARGDGGFGGAGGHGGNGASPGDINIMGRSVNFAGGVFQPGIGGADGGVGGDGGSVGTTGNSIGRYGDGGRGGNGGSGGNGGNLLLRGGAVSFTSAADSITQTGGGGGRGSHGGFTSNIGGGLDGLSGDDGANGFDGSVSAHSASQSPGVANGSFDAGLSLFRQSFGGSATVADVGGGNMVADLLTDPTGPVTLSQFVSTAQGGPLHVEFDYRFLTDRGTLQVFLDNTLLGELPAVQSADFTHASFDVTDPALLGLDTTELNLRLLPGSIAEAQLDNVALTVPEPAGLASGAAMLMATALTRRRRRPADASRGEGSASHSSRRGHS